MGVGPALRILLARGSGVLSVIAAFFENLFQTQSGPKDTIANIDPCPELDMSGALENETKHKDDNLNSGYDYLEYW